MSVPSDEEQRTFLGRLASLKSNRPVVNSVIPEFCNAYVPMSLAPDLPPVLSSVYETSNLKLGYYELLEKAENTTIIVTPQQVNSVEQKTRDQSNSRLWFKMRSGRITASKFMSVCHTDPANPSVSLIMSICHPESFHFTTAATEWGCQHEKNAVQKYKTKNQSNHVEFNLTSAGFFISTKVSLGRSITRWSCGMQLLWKGNL